MAPPARSRKNLMELDKNPFQLTSLFHTSGAGAMSYNVAILKMERSATYNALFIVCIRLAFY